MERGQLASALLGLFAVRQLAVGELAEIEIEIEVKLEVEVEFFGEEKNVFLFFKS